MKVVSVVAQKGGTGKTTLSVATACAATADGLSTVIVDLDPQATAARLGRPPQIAVAAAKAADLIVVPCRPAVYDLVTVLSTLDVVRAVAPGVGVLCVLNGVPPRDPTQRHAREVLAHIGIRVCPVSLGLRAAVDYAAAVGLSAQEHEPRSKTAIEIASVYKFIRELVDLPTQRQADGPTAQRADLPTERQVDPPDWRRTPTLWPRPLTCGRRS